MTRLAGVFSCLLFLLFSFSSSATDSSFSAGNDGRIIEVTTLEDEGPGSFRAAVESGDIRKIVFKVGGEIWLKKDLLIRNPFMTIAGETAPSPGITLMGDRVRLRTHDLIMRHIRIRVGALPTGFSPQNRDALTIDGTEDGSEPAYNILIENCSFSWSIDELIQIWGPGSHNITIRRNIIAEALNNSIHPKGPHSMGLVVGPGVKNVLIEQNLFAHNMFRNPVIAGAEATVLNNLIYNPGHNGVHFYPGRKTSITTASIIGNVMVAGPNTKPKIGAFAHGLNEGSQIYYADNQSVGSTAFISDERMGRLGEKGETPFVQNAPVSKPDTRIIPTKDVEPLVLYIAGSRPNDRDNVDKRIIQEVRTRKGMIRDTPTDPRLAAPEGTVIVGPKQKKEKKARI